MADDVKRFAAKIAALRQDYEELRRRQARVLAKRPAALEAALRRAYSDLWAKPRHVQRGAKPHRVETVTVEGPNIPREARRLFDKPSLIALRIAKEDHSKAAGAKVEKEAKRLLLALGGDLHLLKKRLRAGTATHAEQSLSADLLDIHDGIAVHPGRQGRPTRRGKPVKPSDELGRQLLKKFLAEIEATLPDDSSSRRRRRRDALNAWDRELQNKEHRALTKADIRWVAEQYGVRDNIFYKILKAFPKAAARFKQLPPGS